MATLLVPGARLYYEVRGSGPMLLISQSGEGDAGRSADMVDQLVDDHTVVTYDRRGLSRSTLDDPGRPVTMREHTDDVNRLLAELTDVPVAMLGCSFGAVIGLHLAVRHPGRLGTLVAHEPVAPWLLSGAERALHERELADIQDLYRKEGLRPALQEIAEVLGIEPGRGEPDVTPQPLTPQRIANFGFFIERDFTAVLEDERPDLIALGSLRVVPAVGGRTPRTVYDRRCAQELADLLGAEPVEFPGGHNGNTSHPRAFAARLRQVLA